MRAAVWHGYKDIRIEEKAEPVPGPGQVKIKVDWAGICGTDRHEYEGPNFIPVKKPHRLTGRVAPLIIGHEFSGEIVELGEGVEGWKTGDRVTANGSLTCGKCEACRSGRYNICQKLGFLGVGDDGAFADYVVVEASRLFAIPERCGSHRPWHHRSVCILWSKVCRRRKNSGIRHRRVPERAYRKVRRNLH